MDDAILRIVTMGDGWGIAVYTLITMAISGVLSLVIGLERELKGEPAGLSTHILIAVSCSLLMTLSIWAIRNADGTLDIFGSSRQSESSNLNYDTSRIAAAVVTGIGFLGAGAIIKNGFNVRGLSTAATLWISAAIGLSCGAGFILEAIIATTITFGILMLASGTKTIIERKSPSMKVEVKKGYPIISKINKISNENSMVIRDLKAIEYKENSVVIQVNYAFRTECVLIEDVANSLKNDENVIDARLSNHGIR